MEFDNVSNLNSLQILAVEYDTDDDLESMEEQPKHNNKNHENWKTKEHFNRRENGKTYYGKKKNNNKWNYKVLKNKRSMKGACGCALSQKGTTKIKCHQLTESDRLKNFKLFWQMSWNEKKIFINENVKLIKTNRHRQGDEDLPSRRTQSMIYFLKKNDTNVRVCKKMFQNTLAIGNNFTHSWKTEATSNAESTSESSQQLLPRSNLSQRQHRLHIRQFFGELPKMESHYCRSTSSKIYLEPNWQTKRELFRTYQTWNAEKEVR